MATTPETSDFTSIKQRIHYAVNQTQPNTLKPFVGNLKKDMLDVIPFELKEYIELVEVTGRCVREDKAGHIDNNLPTLLGRLNIEPDNWLVMTKQFTTVFHGAVGNEHVLQNFVEHKQLKRRANLSSCRRLLA
jgi:hypothetical protein